MYHTELSRDGPGLLLRDIEKGDDPQILASLRVIEYADADAIVLADFDFDANLAALNAYADRLGGYPFRFALAPNRGVQTGQDLDGDGRFGEPEDAQGYGRFAGDGGLAILSKWPIDASAIQDFSSMLWEELEGNIAPEAAVSGQRLSTTGHWIVPLKINEKQQLNLMVWHATPPVFDGPEDLNGRRNHDEAALWLKVLDGSLGTTPNGPFILAGISNLDPIDGDGRPDAIKALLSHPMLTDPSPESAGARRANDTDGGINLTQKANPETDTVDWQDTKGRPGNLRVTLALPSKDLTVRASGVLWPAEATTSLGRDVRTASRHRLVWLDLCISDC